MNERVLADIREGKTHGYAAFGLLMREAGKAILAKRNTEPHKGRYSLVGGKLDLSALNRGTKTPVSFNLNEDGLEAPTHAMLRELTEEVYRSHINSTAEELEALFRPVRSAIVYDYVHNAYATLYTIQAPNGLTPVISKRELGDLKIVDELCMDQLNPLTGFFFHHQGLTSEKPKGVSSGPIRHMVLSGDAKGWFRSKSSSYQKSCTSPTSSFATKKTAIRPSFAFRRSGAGA